MQTGLALAAGLLTLALLTALAQVRGLRRLRARTLVPSTEAAFLRSRYRRRLLTSFVLAVIGCLIAGAYLSGLERATDAIAPGDAERPEMTPEQKQLLRIWVFYWAGVIVLGLALLGLAFSDALATRRYWFLVYKELREDHQQRLQRDLAVHRQQKNEQLNGRMKSRNQPGG